MSSEGCAAVQQDYFGGVLSQDDFNAIDANKDGEINVDEVMYTKTALLSRSDSRNDDGIEY